MQLVALRAMPGISAVIPANNEEDSIEEIVHHCRRYCAEVIVVDDGSTDDTAAVSEAAGAKIVRNTKRLGIVKSIEKGLRLASEAIIVTLDGDGQHDPLEIESLVRFIVKGEADLVLGARRGGIPASERLICRFVNFRVKCSDVGTGYRALTAQLAEKMHLWGFCLCGSFIIEANRRGARVAEVPIRIKPRGSGRSHWESPLSRGWMHFKQLLLLTIRLIFA